MKKALDFLFGILKAARKRALPFLAATVFFVVLLFPYDDLGEFVAGKVAQVTQGQVSLNFDHLGLRLFPTPGLDLTDVYIESAFTPSLSAKSVGIAPDIFGFLSFRPGVSLSAEGLLGGDMGLTVRTGSKTEKGVATQKISFESSGLKLSELQKAGMLPVNADGNLGVEANVVIDPSMGDQPDGDLRIQLQKLSVPNAVLNTPAGPAPFPGLNLKKLLLGGALKNGKFTISEGNIGEEGAEISGKVTGNMDIRILGAAGNYTYQLGSYSFDLNLKLKKAFEQKIEFYLALTPLKKCKKEGAGGADSIYSCRVSAPNIFTPMPNVQAL